MDVKGRWPIITAGDFNASAIRTTNVKELSQNVGYVPRVGDGNFLAGHFFAAIDPDISLMVGPQKKSPDQPTGKQKELLQIVSGIGALRAVCREVRRPS